MQSRTLSTRDLMKMYFKAPLEARLFKRAFPWWCAENVKRLYLPIDTPDEYRAHA